MFRLMLSLRSSGNYGLPSEIMGLMDLLLLKTKCFDDAALFEHPYR